MSEKDKRMLIDKFLEGMKDKHAAFLVRISTEKAGEKMTFDKVCQGHWTMRDGQTRVGVRWQQ